MVSEIIYRNSGDNGGEARRDMLDFVCFFKNKCV